jgi:hypothetical protein
MTRPPVSSPFATSSTVGTGKVDVQAVALTRSAKKVKPPDTSSTFMPCLLAGGNQLGRARVDLQRSV